MKKLLHWGSMSCPGSDGNFMGMEGKVKLVARSSGGERGPGSRAPVFYNPAMVHNRDLSVLAMQALIDSDAFSGEGPVRILDGLTGSGIRAVRFARELRSLRRELDIEAVDLKEESVESGRKLASLNSADVEFHILDLNAFYRNRRFHYIDVDPYGTPVPFIQNAVNSLKKDGILAVTATDTAALTGSVPRVARRRYGVLTARTHFMQELGARTLAGYIARVAASFDRSAVPLFSYTRDHFIRLYMRISRGAKRTDLTLSDLGWLDYQYPRPPAILSDPSAFREGSPSGKAIGPVWTGMLSEAPFVKKMLELLENGEYGHLASARNIGLILERTLSEDDLPPGGFDLNETASSLAVSPPPVKYVSERIMEEGYDWSRSRFSPTLVKTDAPWNIIRGSFLEER